MKNNPFTSEIFTSIWFKHFYKKKEAVSTECIPNIKFVTHSIWPLLINVGRTNTKGLPYTVIKSLERKFQKNAFLIYDVPNYLPQQILKATNLKRFKIKQYPGFLVNFESYASLDDYLKKNLSKNSRQKITRYKKRLELCFEIKHTVFIGEMSKQEYDQIFHHFKRILTKRFDDKQISNNNLNDDEWDFYYEVTYPMILERKAALFVTYDNDLPIAITLQNFSEDTVFDVIRTFDIDYSKFHLGSVSILNLIEWCINNNYKILDFSKGEYEYKRSWSTLNFNYEYHIIYNPKSITSFATAILLKFFFNCKQYLRALRINELLHRITFMLNVIGKQKNKNKPHYRILDTKVDISINDLTEIDVRKENNHQLNNILNEFLFLHSERKNDVKVFHIPGNMETPYLIQGKRSQKLIEYA